MSDWKERFDKTWGTSRLGGHPSAMKQFISSELAAAREEERAKYKPLVEAVKPFGVAAKNNEATSYPWWFIVDPQQNLRCDISAVAMNITGPFLSRETAEQFLKNTRYNFGKRAAVWCGSGTYSPEYRVIFDAALKAAEEGK